MVVVCGTCRLFLCYSARSARRRICGGPQLSAGSFVPVNALQPTLDSGNGFIAELDPTGTTLLFSSLIGGAANQAGFTMKGLAVDGLANVYTASYTYDTTLPTTPGAFQPALKNPGTGNSYDGFIARFSLAPSITPGGIGPVFSSATTIQPGEWISIYGLNLAGTPTTWTGNFPTSLGGTRVAIDGKQAYLWYVSPTQINLQVPDDANTGAVPVVVTTPNGAASSTVTLAPFAPSFSLLDAKHVAGIILRSDGSGAYGGGSYDIRRSQRKRPRLQNSCGQGRRQRCCSFRSRLRPNSLPPSRQEQSSPERRPPPLP